MVEAGLIVSQRDRDGVRVGDGVEQPGQFAIRGTEERGGLVGLAGENRVVGFEPVPVHAHAPRRTRGAFDSLGCSAHQLKRRLRLGHQRVDELAALQRLEQRHALGLPGRLAALAQHALGEAAVFALELDEARQNARDAELRRIAAVDARQQGLGQVVHGFPAVVRGHEFGHGLVRLPALARPAEPFEAHANLGVPAQQRGA